MIYICADDYGLSDICSENIQKCIDEGGLNKVSIFPNFDSVDFEKISARKEVAFSLHLNLVEGKCMSEPWLLDLIADENGNFRHSFIGLLKLNLFYKKEFENQIYREIKAQISFWKNILPENTPFLVDSHQHTHMIPSVFKALVRVLEDEKIDVKYLRIPAEPLIPYIKTPSLYFTYKPVNIIKQWLIKFLWMINKRQAEKYKDKTAYFFGVLFSGRMDERRVNKVLPKYIKLAEKKNNDIEVLFHPGYVGTEKINFEEKNASFKKFYLSEDRKREFDTVMKMKKKEEIASALY